MKSQSGELVGGWSLYFVFCVFFLFHTRLAGRSAEDFSWKNNLWIFFYFVFLSRLFLHLHTISLLIFFLLDHKRKLARFEALIWCLKSTTSFAAISWLYARDHQKKNLKSHEWIALTMERRNESVDVDFELDPRLCADKRLVFLFYRNRCPYPVVLDKQQRDNKTILFIALFRHSDRNFQILFFFFVKHFQLRNFSHAAGCCIGQSVPHQGTVRQHVMCCTCTLYIILNRITKEITRKKKEVLW